MYTLKKRGVMEPNEALRFTTAAFGSLMYYKALDDKRDEKGVKRFFTCLAVPIFRRMAKKAEKMYPGIGAVISEPLEKLGETELACCPVPDMAADNFALVTAGIASFGLDGAQARVARDIGYHIGRFVYLMDAVDDRYEDQRKNSYNPINLCYSSAEKADENMDFIRRTILDSAAAISRSYALADGNVFDGIIYNIAGYGSEIAVDKAINKEKK